MCSSAVCKRAWDFLIITTEALMVYFMDKSTAENRALEEHGEIHMIMGRKAGTHIINPKRFGSLQKPCMKEMALFLSCMAANHSDIEACAKQKELLNACIDSQSKKNRKSWGSINYQLQRLSRGRNTWGGEIFATEFERVGWDAKS
ncbi:hypothetical protein CR513_38992, partial [Mucuna pruriens]